ncbi:MAG: VapE domain-containing protein [Bdellovibrionota bacterium]
MNNSQKDINNYISKKTENQGKNKQKEKLPQQEQDAFNVISAEIYNAESVLGGQWQNGAEAINHVFTSNLVLKDNGAASPKFTKEAIAAVYMRIEKDRHIADINELKQKIKYNGKGFHDALIYFKKFAAPMIKKYGEEDLNHDEYVTVVAKVIMHTIWQLKRRLHGLPVKLHCCIALISPEQGNGKTTFLLNFFSVVFEYKRLSAIKKISDITDPRESEENAKKVLILFDEMSGAAKSDIADLKSRMTSDTLNTRPLYSNFTNTYVHNTTYIATANTDNLGEHLVDKSGDRNRRFFPVHVNSFIDVKMPTDRPHFFCHLSEEEKKKGYLYPEKFNGTYLLQLIDENWDCFLSLEEMKSVQEVHRSKSEVEEFIELVIYREPSPDTVRNYSLAELYTCFKKIYPKNTVTTRKFSSLFEKHSKIEKNKESGVRKNGIGFKCGVDKYIWELHMGK